MSNLQQGFQGTGGPVVSASLVSWLERADAQLAIQEVKRQMLALGPGDRVLDVGCGIGLEVMRLAEHVGPAGRVVGIDANPSLIVHARERATGTDLPVEFTVMDARQLDLPDGTFDLCRAERVLRYIDDPDRVVQEMVRVVRPGGRVVVFDFDSDATVVDAPDPALVRRIREILDAAVPNCWMGRQLPRHFRRAGLVDIALVPHVVMLPTLECYRRLVEGSLNAAVQSGALTAAELTRWWAFLEQAECVGGIVVANLGFVVHGRRSPE